MATPTPTAAVLCKNFDVGLLNIEPSPARNSVGAKFLRITYGSRKQPLKLQSPAVYMPFGVSTYTDADKGSSSQSVEASLRGHMDPACPGMQAFYQALKAIDEAVLAAAERSSEAWFGKKMSRAILAEFQRSLVKDASDKYPPLFKAKVATDFKTGLGPRVYDEARVERNMDYIVRGTTARLLVSFPSVYVISKTFGISPRLMQVAVADRPPQDTGCQLVDDDDEQDE